MVTNYKWGADPAICLLFYRATVRSVIDYGSIFYGQASECHLSKVDNLQRRCRRICLGLLPSTLIIAVLGETGELPLRYRYCRAILSDKYVLKLKSQQSNILRDIVCLTANVLVHPNWDSKTIPPWLTALHWTSFH